jgi:hypothetical protein
MKEICAHDKIRHTTCYLKEANPVSKQTTTFRANARLARSTWHGLSKIALESLKQLTRDYNLSIARGHIQLLDDRWYITHAGLLRIAERNHCFGIRSNIEKSLSNPHNCRWVFRATVFKSARSKGFVGYGDADPSNVSSLVRGAEMRVAETRAVNRALRKAYGIGLCSVEELGWSPRSSGANQSKQNGPSANGNNGHQKGQPRLRDRLCLLIRQHRLDAGLVKAYAADYCGTPTLRDASRVQVEAFINHLTERALNDREALLWHLNSYPKREDVKK